MLEMSMSSSLSLVWTMVKAGAASSMSESVVSCSNGLKSGSDSIFIWDLNISAAFSHGWPEFEAVNVIIFTAIRLKV